MWKNIPDRVRWIIVIVLIVAVIGGAVFGISYITARKNAPTTEMQPITIDNYLNEADAMDQSGKPYRRNADGTLSLIQEPAYTPSPEEIEAAIDPDAMTTEDVFNLTDEELAVYLNQVEWDDDFQNFVDADTETHDDPFYYEKLYLEWNPDYKIPGFGNPYAEPTAYTGSTPEQKAEAEAWAEEAENANYKNDVVTWQYGSDGQYISIGSESFKKNDAIYMTPYCSETESGKTIGFLFAYNQEFDVNSAEAGNTGSVFWFKDESQTKKYPTNGNYIICGEKYAFLYPAQVDLDSNIWYLRWKDIGRAYGFPTKSSTVYCRVIDLDTNELITVFNMDIRYNEDSDTYYIADIYSGDVRMTGALSESERLEAINDAVYFIQNNDKLSFLADSTDWDYAREHAFVEHTYDSMYYSAILNSTFTANISSIELGANDVYYVELPAHNYGYVTVVMVPEREFLYGFTTPRDSETNLSLLTVGMEKFMPFSTDENAVPFSTIGKVLGFADNGLAFIDAQG